MSRTWICLLFVGSFCLANALTYSSEAHEGESEYWPDDYEEWYQTFENSDKDEAVQEDFQDNVEENTNLRDFGNRDYDTSNRDQYDDNVDLMIEKETQQTRDSSDVNQLVEDNRDILDYQFEDNRSDLEERNFLETGNDDGLPDKVSGENFDSSQLDDADENSQSDEELNENIERIGDVSKSLDSIKNDDTIIGKMSGEMLRGNDDDFDGSDNVSMRENDHESQENQETQKDELVGSFAITDDQQANDENGLELPLSEDDKIFKETMSILNENDDEGKFENDDSLVKSEPDIDAAFFDETKSLLEQFDDTLDLNEEVDHSIQNAAVSEQAEGDDASKVIREDTLDEAYDDLNEDLEKLFSTIKKLSSDDVANAENENENEKTWFSDEFDYDSAHNSFEESDTDNDENIDRMFDEMFGTDKEINPDDDIPQEAISTNSLSNEQVQNNEEKNIESTVREAAYDDNPLNYTGDSETDKKIFDDYMNQFKATHQKELDTEAKDFDRHIAPVFVTLSVSEPVVITSPNYPEPYPANNIIDWVFEGDGIGIEFNITDFAINGIIGDYLLVKPGGVDESGNEGLVFTFNLKEPRRYIFSDVDRMFVRFVANPGLSLLGITGFQFSVRQLAHRRGADLPETPAPPEPLLPEVTSTHTVHLALSPEDFEAVAEQFQQLIADMATFYIHYNNIAPGLNTTSETTRILNSTICNVKWPNYESCTRVRFGVPLVYEEDEDYRLDEDDLRDMWETLSIQNPFALRLSNLGIEEISPPNDRAILTAWAVIAAAVVVAMAVVAFAMWRSSCFVPYTRMPAFSDTDSMHSGKKDLDLYPAPHQDLPPLYSENEYKWVTDDTTRVDMGGYANRSYVRDELYSIDSDEEVVKTRDRYTTDV